jgi:hypothetical protein
MGAGVKNSTFKPKSDWKLLKRSSPLARGTSTLKPVGARAKRTRQGKVAANAEEQAWMDDIVQIGCIVCRVHHNVITPAAVHHPLSGGRRMGHLFAIPLCDPGHHQNSPTPLKISRHPNKAQFEHAYGTELDLLELTKGFVALLRAGRAVNRMKAIAKVP